MNSGPVHDLLDPGRAHPARGTVNKISHKNSGTPRTPDPHAGRGQGHTPASQPAQGDPGVRPDIYGKKDG